MMWDFAWLKKRWQMALKHVTKLVGNCLYAEVTELELVSILELIQKEVSRIQYKFAETPTHALQLRSVGLPSTMNHSKSNAIQYPTAPPYT